MEEDSKKRELEETEAGPVEIKEKKKRRVMFGKKTNKKLIVLQPVEGKNELVALCTQALVGLVDRFKQKKKFAIREELADSIAKHMDALPEDDNDKDHLSVGPEGMSLTVIKKQPENTGGYDETLLFQFEHRGYFFVFEISKRAYFPED